MHGLSCSAACGSSQTRARTHVTCIGRRILNHCATRDASHHLLLLLFNQSLLLAHFYVFDLLFAFLALPTAHHFSCCPFFSAQTVAAGGNGYINDFPMGRFLRDAKLYEIGAGTSEVRRLIIGRAFNAEFH